MKSFATTVALLGLASSASALFTTNSSIFGNQAGSDLGCFNTFEATNSQGLDVCLIGLLGGAFFLYFIGPSLGMNVDTQERYGYDNAYNYEQQRGDLGKHPFATSGNIVSKAVSKIANFWRKRLQDASIVEREYPYGQTFHPEQQQQAEALKA